MTVSSICSRNCGRSGSFHKHERVVGVAAIIGLIGAILLEQIQAESQGDVGRYRRQAKVLAAAPDVSSINAEQMLAADGETIKRPKDRVGHQRCLVARK